MNHTVRRKQEKKTRRRGNETGNEHMPLEIAEHQVHYSAYVLVYVCVEQRSKIPSIISENILWHPQILPHIHSIEHFTSH